MLPNDEYMSDFLSQGEEREEKLLWLKSNFEKNDFDDYGADEIAEIKLNSCKLACYFIVGFIIFALTLKY